MTTVSTKTQPQPIPTLFSLRLPSHHIPHHNPVLSVSSHLARRMHVSPGFDQHRQRRTVTEHRRYVDGRLLFLLRANARIGGQTGGYSAREMMRERRHWVR